MTILYAATAYYNGEQWMAELNKWFPDEIVERWPDVADPDAVEYLVCWDLDVKEMAAFTNLKAILVAGAGINHLQPFEDIPNVPLVRLVDPAVAGDIANYAMHWAIHFHRHMPTYAQQQRAAEFIRHPYAGTGETTIGVLGLGAIGTVIAERAIANGYRAAGWSRSAKSVEGVDLYAGTEQLREFLGHCQIVVNVLPLTPATDQVIDADAIAAMPDGSFIINVGRGATIDDDALCDALTSGKLAGAALDVLREEPLPPDSPLWKHAGIFITPHISGFTYPETAVALMAANINRVMNGEDPFPVVDRTIGY